MTHSFHKPFFAMAGSSWATTAGAPVLLEIATYSGSAALVTLPLIQSDKFATFSAVQSRVVDNVRVAAIGGLLIGGGLAMLPLGPPLAFAIAATVVWTFGEMLMLIDEHGQQKLEPGKYKLTAGSCSPGAALVPRALRLG